MVRRDSGVAFARLATIDKWINRVLRWVFLMGQGNRSSCITRSDDFTKKPACWLACLLYAGVENTATSRLDGQVPSVDIWYACTAKQWSCRTACSLRYYPSTCLIRRFIHASEMNRVGWFLHAIVLSRLPNSVPESGLL